MPTQQKIEDIKKLGIIAGGGVLPQILIRACEEKNIKPYVVAFKGQTNDQSVSGQSHLWTSLGRAGEIINFFKSNDVVDIAMIGSIKRPPLALLKPDFKGMQIMSKIGLRSMGDDSILKVLSGELQKEGFRLRGIQEFCGSLLMTEGVLGKIQPLEDDEKSIELGIRESQILGAQDIGQAVIVQQGHLVALEDKNGTDALIRRSQDALKKQGRGGILIKTCKPQQNKFLDMPTIGVNTIENARGAGLCGVVLHAGNVLVTDLKEVEELADKYRMFVVGRIID